MSGVIVVDASVAIKWVIPEEGTEAALSARTDFAISAPELLIPEMANILWKKHQRRELNGIEASVAAELLAKAGITLIPMADLMLRALELAIRLNHPAYDCIYIATAGKLGCPFVTADSKLIRKLRQQGFDEVECRDLLERA